MMNWILLTLCLCISTCAYATIHVNVTFSVPETQTGPLHNLNEPSYNSNRDICTFNRDLFPEIPSFLEFNSIRPCVIHLKKDDRLDYDVSPSKRNFIFPVLIKKFKNDYQNPSFMDESVIWVSLYIQDVNDEYPYFINRPKLFLSTVAENAQPGTVIFTLKAHDRDKDSNIVFNVESSQSNRFHIDSKSGVVTTVGSEKFVYGQYYIYGVSVQDLNAEYIQKSEIHVLKIHVGRLEPQFYSLFYKANVPESAKPGHKIITIDAISHQKLPLVYEIINMEIDSDHITDETGYFFIDSETGIVKLKKIIDYEVEQIHLFTFTVKVTEYFAENPSQSLSSLVEVEIEIIDVNDYNPTFSLSQYIVTNLSEDTDVGITILKLVAIDLDSGQNANISYSIDHEYFYVSSVDNEALIKIKKYLDYETSQNHMYTFSITAKDHGDPPLSSSTMVRVVVTNVNDENPVFINSNQHVEVSEDAEIGTIVHVVQAYDPDGDIVSYSFKSLAETSHGIFKIDYQSGTIKMIKSFSSNIDEYVLDIVAIDDDSCCKAMGHNLKSSATLTVHVKDINNNVPIFPLCDSYTMKIQEGLSIGSTIGYVLATDSDAGINGKIKYSFVPRLDQEGGYIPFIIEEDTGLIKSDAIFDRETKETYGLTIKAEDGGGLAGLCVLNIKISDRNDNKPFYSLDSYIKQVDSNIVGTNVPIVQIFANDLDAGLNGTVSYYLKYNFPGAEIFMIDKDTGWIYITKKWDKPLNNVTLTAYAQDNGVEMYKSADTHVHILFQYDTGSYPQWEFDYNKPIYMDENVHTDFIVTRLKVSEPHEQISYVIVPGKSIETNGEPRSFHYTIDDKTNEMVIMVYRPLDYESMHSYNLTIKATVKGMETMYNDTRINIKLNDVNDEIPEFVGLLKFGSYRGNVAENSKIGTPVIKVKAIDRDDKPSFKTIRYAIKKNLGSDWQHFDIDEYSGEIITRSVFDREEKEQYFIRVIATDGAPSARVNNLQTKSNAPNKGEADVEIIITDKNDNPPYFDNTLYEISVAENSHVGSQIATITANDVDTDNKLTYSIYNQFDQTFEVIPHSGAIVVRRKLDFEAEQKVYKLRYRVFDEKFSNFTEIEIKVTDVNDNAPVFDQDVYTVENILEEDDSITKNSPKFLLQVKATDPDIERNSEIVYALTGQFAESAFNIDKYSGNIYLLKPLDRDKPFGRPIYNVNVLAYDEPNSSFSMVGYSEIRIILTDINDNEPQFNLKRLDGYIMENKIGPIDIIRVEAKDADFGNNAQVKYKINENVDMSYLDMPLNEIKNLFKIDKDSGWISSRFGTKFDRENIDKYTFSVRAYDQGYTHSNYNNIWVTIHVDDDNDNVPKFGQSLYEVEMYELFPIGSNIITISASDSDIDENAQLTYTISEENRNFFIIESIAATNQGVLKVAKSVDYENLSQRFFNISVRVHDSNEQKFDTARIEVTVLDSNDMAPRFASDYITRKVKENIPIGTVIAQFFAVDGDTGINSEFTYQFDPISQESKLFSIDSVSGKLENINYLDREIQSHFIISVYAVDRGIPSLNSTATLDLTLDDVNDSYPRFSKSYNPIIMENTDPSNFKFVVEAVDDDSVINGPPFIFSLPCFGKCPCSLLPTFCGLFNLKFIPNNGVNDNQAIITVNSKEPFDREEVKFYNLPINISDSGLPVQWGFNILKITIGDENDNEHSSGTKNIKFYNYKGSFKDVFIGTVYSKDPDDWDAPEKLHKLIKVSPSEVKTKFKVTSLGYIFTSGILSPKIYTLDVEVTDPTFGLTVTSKVVVDVLDLNDEFLINSGSMLIENTDAIEFIQEDNVSESKLTTFKKFMSKKLSFPIDSILVFSIMNYDSNPKLCEKCIQVFYAVKNSPWQKPERLDSIVNHYKSELESLDIIVLMSPIDNCRTLNFNPCTLNSEIVTPCYKELRIHETEPQNVVNANKTSFIGLNVYYEYHCKSKVPERYVTGKFCPTLYCLNGGRCVKVFGKYECECIGGFSGPRCQQTFISFSLSNPEQIDASFTVLEPFNIDSKHIVNLDFMTKRENGILLFNNGNVQKLNIHFPKLQDLNSLQVRKYYYQNYLSQMEKKRQNNYCSLLLYLKNGFVILKLFDSNNVFSVDMSSNDLTKKLNDGIWHSIKIIFMEKSVSVIIDDCENLKDLSSQTVDVSSCMNFIDIPKYKRIFASPHPVYLGGIYLDNDSNDSNLKRILNFLKTENVNSYSGCIKNVYHNDWIKDLHVGNRGFGKNIKDGCPDAFLSCGFKPGLLGSFTKVGYCGQNAYCTGSMIEKHWCTCKSGWTGENCSQETNQINFLDNSVIEWRHNIETPLLGFFNNAFVSKLQLSFRTRQNSGLLFSAEFADQYLRLDIINDNIRIRAQLSNGRIISANMDHYFISDGMWHNIIVKRIGHVIIINADDGQIHYSVNMYSHNNIYSSDTLKFNTPSTKFLAGAQIDDIMIYNDYRDSCINDVRFMDVNFEIHLKQSDVVAEKIKTVLIKNVKMGCISNVCNSSHPSYTECIEPLQCFDLWRLKDCRCGEGFELNSSPNKKLTCLNVNECLTFSPCHYGTCIDTVPGFSCTCEDDYTGELCNAQAIRMLEISGVSISIIVIVVLILLIVAISLLLITQRRRYRKKLVNEKEENYNCQKFVDYDVEAADEEDTNNFDLSKLRKPINTISNIVDGQGNKISPSEIEKRLQNDKPTPSEDSLLTFHHSTECHDSDDNLSYISELSFQKINVSGVIENLKNFGPKFANIAKLYHHSDQENV